VGRKILLAVLEFIGKLETRATMLRKRIVTIALAGCGCLLTMLASGGHGTVLDTSDRPEYDNSAWIDDSQVVPVLNFPHYHGGPSGTDPADGAVPEPGSLMLASIGAMGLGAFALRRRRR
jgi:hypothetical protein